MSFPPDFLDRLRSSVALADLVGRKVKLTRRGREYVGLSPFSQEKTPSFYVVPDKGFYHCFSSGEHGDAIAWLMKMEGLSFPEAVEKLAAEAGMVVPQDSPQEREAAKRRATLYEATEAAAVWFSEQLASSAGAAARDYLERRGLTKETIAQFRLGFAPNQRGLLRQALNARGIDDDRLVEAGLMKRPEEGGELRDYFFDRVIFPITDRRGRVIAFGARAMDPQAKAKYLNSPDNPLFHKGQTLYNLNLARKAAHDLGEIVVAEGYMDVIAMAQAGFPAAVAPLGTAVTEEQIKELWRMASEPIICLDGDSAGQRAGFRAAERALALIKPGSSLRFAVLPAGEDPDSLVQVAGAQALRDVLNRAMPLSELLWQVALREGKTDTPERRAALRQRLMDFARAIEDPGVSAAYKNDMLERFDGAFGFAARQRRKGKGNWTPGPGGRQKGGNFPGPRYPRPPVALLKQRPFEALLGLSLAYPQVALDFLEDLAELESPARELEALKEVLIDSLAAQHDLDSEALECHLSNLGHANVLSRLMGDSLRTHEAFIAGDAQPVQVRERFLYWLERAKETLSGQAGSGPPGQTAVFASRDEGVTRVGADKKTSDGATSSEPPQRDS